ncbi:hypothetical protein ACJX0J_008918 [Zea mays]
MELIFCAMIPCDCYIDDTRHYSFFSSLGVLTLVLINDLGKYVISGVNFIYKTKELKETGQKLDHVYLHIPDLSIFESVVIVIHYFRSNDIMEEVYMIASSSTIIFLHFN